MYVYELLVSIISYTLIGISSYSCSNPVSALSAAHLRFSLVFHKPVYGSHGDRLTGAQFYQFSSPPTIKVETQLFFL